jgi:hypothetical protein
MFEMVTIMEGQRLYEQVDDLILFRYLHFSFCARIPITTQGIGDLRMQTEEVLSRIGSSLRLQKGTGFLSNSRSVKSRWLQTRPLECTKCIPANSMIGRHL